MACTATTIIATSCTPRTSTTGAAGVVAALVPGATLPALRRAGGPEDSALGVPLLVEDRRAVAADEDDPRLVRWLEPALPPDFFRPRVAAHGDVLRVLTSSRFLRA